MLIKTALNIAVTGVSCYNAYKTANNFLVKAPLFDSLPSERFDGTPITPPPSAWARQVRLNALLYNAPVLAVCCYTALRTNCFKAFLLGAALGLVLNLGPVKRMTDSICNYISPDRDRGQVRL